MGFFKKEICCICGEKAGMLTRQKLADKTYLCGDCVGKCSSGVNDERFRRMVKEDVLEHLDYVEKNGKRYEDEFQETEKINTGILGKTEVISIDRTHGWWVNAQTADSDIFDFNQVLDYELRLDTSIMDEEEREKQHSFLESLTQSHPTRYGMPVCPPNEKITRMTVVVHLNHPWIDEVRLNVMDALFVSDGDIQAGYECAERLFDFFEQSHTTTSTSTSNAASPADELKKYKELLDMDAITKEEYEAKKKELLNL